MEIEAHARRQLYPYSDNTWGLKYIICLQNIAHAEHACKNLLNIIVSLNRCNMQLLLYSKSDSLSSFWICNKISLRLSHGICESSYRSYVETKAIESHELL